MRRIRIPLLAAAVLLAVLPAAPALAGAAFGGTPDLVAGDGPAVEAPPDVEPEEEQPWTARFLAPTVLLIGVVALVSSILYYGVRIRGRYRVTQ